MKALALFPSTSETPPTSLPQTLCSRWRALKNGRRRKQTGRKTPPAAIPRAQPFTLPGALGMGCRGRWASLEWLPVNRLKPPAAIPSPAQWEGGGRGWEAWL